MCDSSFKPLYELLSHSRKANVRRQFAKAFSKESRDTFYKKINGVRPIYNDEKRFLTNNLLCQQRFETQV
jgi:GTP-sensing pleiotropic transcriptional regulator CodY